ncbi:inositol-phosphate phosphatase [Gammaproteobacteria bacterium]
MNSILTIAIRAARAAGDIIIRSMEQVDHLQIDLKGTNDFVTDVDRRAEREIIRILRRAYPSHAILGEESGASGNNESVWVIDPLDGTTNFLHGFPQFSVSIALRHAGRLEQAVVYDPLHQELFTASRGEGAHLNDRRIRVSSCRGLEGALLGTGFPFRLQHYLDDYLNCFRALFARVADIRRPGSAALDLAYVAAGRLDGFWEMGLAEWDMAAGALLIMESGGLVGDFTGGENFWVSGNIVGGNPKVFKAILQTIQPHLPDALKK